MPTPARYCRRALALLCVLRRCALRRLPIGAAAPDGFQLGQPMPQALAYVGDAVLSCTRATRCCGRRGG